jgi:hypothetical protein
MKVLGLTCGRKLSNTEIVVKEALMGAEEMGAEVEIVRLMDLHIKPCTGCNACVLELGKTSEKVLCAVCGVKGTLKSDGDAYALEVTEKDRALSHVLLSGKFHHGEDLKNRSLKPDARAEEIPELIKKYKSYLTYSKPEKERWIFESFE